MSVTGQSGGKQGLALVIANLVEHLSGNQGVRRRRQNDPTTLRMLPEQPLPELTMRRHRGDVEPADHRQPVLQHGATAHKRAQRKNGQDRVRAQRRRKRLPQRVGTQQAAIEIDIQGNIVIRTAHRDRLVIDAGKVGVPPAKGARILACCILAECEVTVTDTGTLMQTTSQTPRNAGEQRRLEDALRLLFEEQIPFNRLLGIRIRSFDPAEARISFSMRPDLVGHFLSGRLHGGVISAVLDAAGSFALMCSIAEKFRSEDALQVMHRFQRMGTIDLRVDYLRPGIGREFTAATRTMRLGGRIGSTHSELVNETGTVIATAAAAYVVS